MRRAGERLADEEEVPGTGQGRREPGQYGARDPSLQQRPPGGEFEDLREPATRGRDSEAPRPERGDLRPVARTCAGRQREGAQAEDRPPRGI